MSVSNEERACLHALSEAWNRYLEIPDLSKEEVDEYRAGIHALQDKVGSRSTYRQLKGEPGVARDAHLLRTLADKYRDMASKTDHPPTKIRCDMTAVLLQTEAEVMEQQGSADT